MVWCSVVSCGVWCGGAVWCGVVFVVMYSGWCVVYGVCYVMWDVVCGVVWCSVA